MRKLLFLLLASLGLFLLPAGAQAYCVDKPPSSPAPIDNPGHLCGTLYRQGFNGSYFVQRPASTSYVKICPSGAPSNSAYCKTAMTNFHLDSYNNPYQSFMFDSFAYYFTQYYYFDLYAWAYYGDDYWGSPDKPVQRIRVGRNGYSGVQLYMPPRALPPNPIYPSGSNVPGSYTVTWNSGIDQDRSPYPVTYEVWYKHWPFGASEPASWLQADSNMPCHDDGSGPVTGQPCSTFIAGPQPAGNWKWYVAANLNVSWASNYTDTVFRTESGWLPFTQPQ